MDRRRVMFRALIFSLLIALAGVLVAVARDSGDASAGALRVSGTAGETPPTTSAAGALAPTAPVPTTAAPVPTTAVPTPATAATGTTTDAPTTPLPTGSHAGSIGVAALGRLTYPWARLGYQISFDGPNPGFLGLTNCASRRIDIYVRTLQTVEQVAYITAFEIAHAVDCMDGTPQTRAAWAAARGFGGPWFPACACSEDHFGSGDFADVFALWAVGPIYPWRSALAPAPTPAQLQVLVAYFRR